ncbi:MAG: hypothetical protein KAJ19_24485, partial [Gammaproteobacteria bacterium]|nr:hypothetical protein [Gammaproteobacteria bacterium]
LATNTLTTYTLATYTLATYTLATYTLATPAKSKSVPSTTSSPAMTATTTTATTATATTTATKQPRDRHRVVWVGRLPKFLTAEHNGPSPRTLDTGKPSHTLPKRAAGPPGHGWEYYIQLGFKSCRARSLDLPYISKKHPL